MTVVGAGGLGTPILTHLAAMGIGTLRVVDRDVVEKTNLHRQTLYTEKDVGRPKVEAAADRLRSMNPECDVKVVPVSVNNLTAAPVVRVPTWS